jgi:hypothetical protein
MTKPRRAKLPAGWRETVCPSCGGDLRYGEMIFSSRSLQGWDHAGTLYVGQDYEDCGDCHDDEHLYCATCLSEWRMPEQFCFSTLDDAERRDSQADGSSTTTNPHSRR